MLKALYDANESRDEQQASADNMELKWEQWETTLRLAEAVRRTVLGRKFFLSKSGYMGFGPRALQKGDMIYILLGCDVPLVIRRVGKHYRLVGECFVWGLMDGEALEGRKENRKFESIPLR